MVEAVAKKYDIASWLAINQLTSLPIQDWLGRDPWMEKHGLDDMLKRAIVFEVENIVRERESQRREQERKVEMQRLEHQSKLQFPREMGSTISKFIN